MSIIGKLVRYFLPFDNLLGLLFTPGMSVVLNMSTASQAFSAFLIIICLMVCTMCSILPTDWWLYGLNFSTFYTQFGMEIYKFLQFEAGSIVT